MAPPALVSLENFSDVQFRDVIHRKTSLVAPTANVLQKLYTHLNGSTPQLSAAEVITTDGNDNNAQYSLLLSSNTRPLNANSITTDNLSSWTANSVMTVNRSNFTIRSNALTANAISCNSLSVASNVSFDQITANVLSISRDATIDTTTLKVDGTLNRVGIVQSSPAYPLDVTGSVNSTTGFLIGGTSVLSSSALGSGVTQSSLTSVGTLGSLNVSGNASVANVTSAWIINTGTAFRVNNNNVLTATTLGSGVTQSSLTSVGTLGSLDVSGNASVANVTSAQVINTGTAFRVNNVNVLTATTLGSGVTSSSLTSVGTLGSLSVSGNVSVGNLSTNTVNATAISGTQLTTSTGNVTFNSGGTSGFHFNAQNKRLGLGLNMTNPSYTVDVYGDVNLTSASKYYIADKVVLSQTSLGNEILSSNLETVGNLTSLRVEGTTNLKDTNITGNVAFSGTTFDFGTYKSAAYKYNINSNTLNAAVQIASVTGGAFKAMVHLVQDYDVNNRISKVYEFIIDKYSSNGGVLQRAIPVQAGFVDTTTDWNDLGLDVATVSGSLNLVVVRTRVGASCSGQDITVTITAYYPKDDPVSFAQVGTQTTSSAAFYYQGNPAMARSDQNGATFAIGTDDFSPGYKLDVNGQSLFRNNIVCNQHMLSKGLYVANVANTTGINFGNMWRLWYNAATQNLEIHKNNNSSATDAANTYTWSSYTVTGILAAQ